MDNPLCSSSPLPLSSKFGTPLQQLLASQLSPPRALGAPKARRAESASGRWPLACARGACAWKKLEKSHSETSLGSLSW